MRWQFALQGPVTGVVGFLIVALFEFELAPVESISPWESPGEPSLSWFALTLGWFRMPVGDQTLFRYTDEILAHWREAGHDAEYQIAAFARDVLGSVAAAVAPLPKSIERLASSWDLLSRLWKQTDAHGDSEYEDELAYAAWRWLGERSPWAGYLSAHPNFQFVRVGDDVHIHWDNRDRAIDGLQVWTAQHGLHVLPVTVFLGECRALVDCLLSAMLVRISGIESGLLRPQCEVSPPSLRQQHETWQAEFASYFSGYEPDIPWDQAENALRAIAARNSIPFQT